MITLQNSIPIFGGLAMFKQQFFKFCEREISFDSFTQYR